jgi:hypothetical protein
VTRLPQECLDVLLEVLAELAVKLQVLLAVVGHVLSFFFLK